jgi:hypothetical protein
VSQIIDDETAAAAANQQLADGCMARFARVDRAGCRMAGNARTRVYTTFSGIRVARGPSGARTALFDDARRRHQ